MTNSELLQYCMAKMGAEQSVHSTVYLDGSLPDSQIYYLVDASYQQAVNTLPADKRRILTQP